MEKRVTIPEITIQIDYGRNLLYLTVNIDVTKILKSNNRTAVGQHTFSLIFFCQFKSGTRADFMRTVAFPMIPILDRLMGK